MEIKLGLINTKNFVETFGTQKLKDRYYKEKRLGGKDKESLLKKANKYCEIQDLSQGKYIITKIYPMEKDDLVVPLKKGLNKFLTPLILSKLIELDCKEKLNKYTLPFLGWANKMDIINGDNYKFIKYHQDKCSKPLNVNIKTMEEFFVKIDLCIKYYLEKNLILMSDKSGLDLIDFESFQMVKKRIMNHEDNKKGGCDVLCKTYDEPISDDDRKFYYDCEKIAKERVGITKNQEKFYGAKSFVYRNELKVLLSKRDILFMYTSYNIYCKDVDAVIDTLAKFNDIDTSPEEFVKVFNENFIEYIEKRAISRKNKEKELELDEKNTKIIKEYRLLESYIPDYRNLSEMTINKNAENVEKKFGIVISKEDKMKYNDINVNIE